jgi:hypothetical protein
VAAPPVAVSSIRSLSLLTVRDPNLRCTVSFSSLLLHLIAAPPSFSSPLMTRLRSEPRPVPVASGIPSQPSIPSTLCSPSSGPVRRAPKLRLPYFTNLAERRELNDVRTAAAEPSQETSQPASDRKRHPSKRLPPARPCGSPCSAEDFALLHADTTLFRCGRDRGIVPADNLRRTAHLDGRGHARFIRRRAACSSILRPTRRLGAQTHASEPDTYFRLHRRRSRVMFRKVHTELTEWVAALAPFQSRRLARRRQMGD